ncbi:hypothetical protein DL96DRAFT_1595785 [Flagelloscypha sp. PMI_526]|nr:hypothetical protein DL96DRAFT_1595785 [Flagelloscypha sp. PMI_526]
MASLHSPLHPNQRASRTQQLPPEILCRILTLYRDTYVSNIHTIPHPSMWSRQLIATIPWATASHVCQHWRKVLLDCPTFWAVLPITNMEWTKVILTRSGNALLKVYLCPLFNPFPGQLQSAIPWPLIDLIFRESNRIDQLCIFVPDFLPSRRVENAIISAFLQSTLSQLRTLQFTSTPLIVEPGTRYQHTKFLRRISEWLPLQLRSLTLRGLSVSQVCSPMGIADLTRLEIDSNSRWIKEPSVGFLLRLLSTLPLLEHLTLRCNIVDESDHSPLNSCVHHSLKFLIIDTTTTALFTSATFLRHLEAPPGLNITITSCFLGTYLDGRTETAYPETGDSRNIDTLRELLAGGIQALFSSISRRHTFSSMLVEASSWGFSILLSRNRKFDLEGCYPWGGSEDAWTYHPRLGSSDIRIELHDLVRDDWVPSSVICPLTMDFLNESQHVFLSETQDCQLRTNDLSVIPWVNALSGATGLQELDLRVSEQTLQSVQAILGGKKEQNYTPETNLSSSGVVHTPPHRLTTVSSMFSLNAKHLATLFETFSSVYAPVSLKVL